MAVSTRMRRTRAALGTLAAATLTAVAVTTTLGGLCDELLVAHKYLDVYSVSRFSGCPYKFSLAENVRTQLAVNCQAILNPTVA